VNSETYFDSQACLEGWDEWVDIVFMASFGLWTHEIIGCEIIGFCDVACHIIGFVYVMLPWLDSSIHKNL
jgi:hypothetical protein